MDNSLRLMLVVIGVFAIFAVLIHAFWINRKESSSLFSERPVKKNRYQNNGDDIRIDSASISVEEQSTILVQSPKDIYQQAAFEKSDHVFETPVKNHEESPATARTNADYPQPTPHETVSKPVTPFEPLSLVEERIEEHSAFFEKNSDVKSNNTYEQIDEQRDDSSLIFYPLDNSILLDDGVEPTQYKYQFTDSANEENNNEIANNTEVNRNTDDVNVLFVPDGDFSFDENYTQKTGSNQEDILILHISALSGGMLRGDSLLSSILQAGFRFGDKQIFHRYLETEKGERILFSLANMVKPGSFEPDMMHDLLTPGVSIFMVIPAAGDNAQNFKIMLQTAQKIADDVGGVVLDEQHHMLTPQKISEYRERIKKVVELDNKYE